MITFFKKMATGQGDDYIIGCLLDYFQLQESYRITALYLSKQKATEADPKAIKQISFTRKLRNNPAIFFIMDQGKEFQLIHKFQKFVKLL